MIGTNMQEPISDREIAKKLGLKTKTIDSIFNLEKQKNCKHEKTYMSKDGRYCYFCDKEFTVKERSIRRGSQRR